MLNISLEYRNKRDDTLPDYDNWKITNNVNILRCFNTFNVSICFVINKSSSKLDFNGDLFIAFIATFSF